MVIIGRPPGRLCDSLPVLLRAHAAQGPCCSGPVLLGGPGPVRLAPSATPGRAEWNGPVALFFGPGAKTEQGGNYFCSERKRNAIALGFFSRGVNRKGGGANFYLQIHAPREYSFSVLL